jgi:hypothetical protein
MESINNKEMKWSLLVLSPFLAAALVPNPPPVIRPQAIIINNHHDFDLFLHPERRINNHHDFGRWIAVGSNRSRSHDNFEKKNN